MRTASRLVQNPAWATDIIASTMETMEESGIPPQWLPRMTDFQARSASRVMADVKEYGCGAYGCVYPTHDPAVVLKLTGDDTEAQFAAELAPTLERPICVHYYKVAEPVGAKDQKGHQVYLLWREAAEHVGRIHEVVEDGDTAIQLINKQHAAAEWAYRTISNIYHPSRVGSALNKGERLTLQQRIAAWLEACEAMARQTIVPELRALGDGMVEVYRSQRIFFGDIHSGNLGMVRRPDGDRWVITDPGHVAVIDDV